MEAASAVASDEQLSGADVIQWVVNLVTKSLIMTDISRDIIHLRLLETTRIYALERLADSRESEAPDGNTRNTAKCRRNRQRVSRHR